MAAFVLFLALRVCSSFSGWESSYILPLGLLFQAVLSCAQIRDSLFQFKLACLGQRTRTIRPSSLVQGTACTMAIICLSLLKTSNLPHLFFNISRLFLLVQCWAAVKYSLPLLAKLSNSAIESLPQHFNGLWLQRFQRRTFAPLLENLLSSWDFQRLHCRSAGINGSGFMVQKHGVSSREQVGFPSYSPLRFQNF